MTPTPETSPPRLPTRTVSSPGRAFVALILAALSGSALSGLAAILFSLVAGALRQDWNILGGGLDAASLVIVFSLPLWAGGLIVVGVPCWIVLHLLGLRERWSGAALGGVATAVAWAALIYGQGRPEPMDNELAWTSIAVLAAVGALVGWVMFSFAYRRPEARR